MPKYLDRVMPGCAKQTVRKRLLSTVSYHLDIGKLGPEDFDRTTQSEVAFRPTPKDKREAGKRPEVFLRPHRECDTHDKLLALQFSNCFCW
jgi:hypothetical protein